MSDNRQRLTTSAIRHARRVRRTTGRVVVSAFGFGVAYYLDMENGAERRRQLQRVLRRTATTLNSVLAPRVEDPPPVFHPLLRGLGVEDCDTRLSHSYEAG